MSRATDVKWTVVIWESLLAFPSIIVPVLIIIVASKTSSMTARVMIIIIIVVITVVIVWFHCRTLLHCSYDCSSASIAITTPSTIYNSPLHTPRSPRDNIKWRCRAALMSTLIEFSPKSNNFGASTTTGCLVMGDCLRGCISCQRAHQLVSMSINWNIKL